MKNLIFAALLLAGAASASADVPIGDAGAVVSAERAFASDAAQRGWIAAFRSYAASDATQLSPDPVNAQQSLAAIQGDGGTNLAWAPSFAGVSRDGALGFTTGPFWSRTRDGVLGQYFTVWRKQSDGSWKWIFDGGVQGAGDARAAETGDVAQLGAPARTMVQHLALDTIRMREDAIIHSGEPAAAVLRDALASSARVNRAGAPPAIGAAASRALISQMHDLDFGRQLRIEAAATGDLVFTLGEATWTEGGAAKRGYYARIWRNGLDGWRVVFDEIVPRAEA